MLERMSANISANCLNAGRNHMPLYIRITSTTLRDYLGREREGGKKGKVWSFRAFSFNAHHPGSLPAQLEVV